MMIVRLTRMSYASCTLVCDPDSVRNTLTSRITVEIADCTINATCGVR